MEENGIITVFEEGALPFTVRRAFIVEVVNEQVRGAHAHRECWQALFALSGATDVETISAAGSAKYRLAPSGKGLVIPPMVWATQSYLGENSSLLALCSHTFEESDYIRTMEEFLIRLSN